MNCRHRRNVLATTNTLLREGLFVTVTAFSSSPGAAFSLVMLQRENKGENTGKRGGKCEQRENVKVLKLERGIVRKK